MNNEYPFYDAIHIWNESKKNDRTAKKLLNYYRKKKRNDKIGFQEFVEKVLDKKQSATVSKGPTALPGGGGGGALIKRQPGALVKADKISKAVPQEGSNILEEILKIVTSIRDTLIKQNEFDKKQDSQQRQSAERRKRKSRGKKKRRRKTENY